MTSRVLITGGAGFVGSHLADALLARGHAVRLYDNFTDQVHAGGLPAYLPDGAEVVHGDMRDPSALRAALQGMDVVFHLAAVVGVGQSMYEIARYMEVNTQGTANLLQGLLDSGCRIEKLVVASSMSIYGEGRYLCAQCGDMSPPPRPPEQVRRKQWETLCPGCGSVLTPVPTDESKPLQCTSVYALSKKDQEELCLLFGRTYGVPVAALRYFNIYGARQALSNPYTGVGAIFAARLLNRRPPLVFEDGMQMRDFVSVRDVVEANLLAMRPGAGDGMALNIGSGQPISIREVAEHLARALGTEIRAEVTGKYRAGDIRHCFADISAAARVLGFRPQVRFEAGVNELAEWVRQQTADDHAAEAARQLDLRGLTA